MIIPVYNGANYLREAIDSALAQTCPDCEVLVINDGSTDNGATEAVALSYGDKIRYFSKENGGVATALNLGMRKMRGDFFSWLSHDDVYLPRHVECLLECRRDGPAGSIVYGDIALMDACGRRLRDVPLPDIDPHNPVCHIWGWSFLNGCAMLIPRDLLAAVGGFREDLPTTQDYDLWFRLSQRGCFRHAPHVVTLSRGHAEQGSRKDGHARECTALLAEYLPQVVAACRRTKGGFPGSARFLAQAVWRRIGDYGMPCAFALAKSFRRHSTPLERMILARHVFLRLPHALARGVWLFFPADWRERQRRKAATLAGVWKKCRQVYQKGGGRALRKRLTGYAVKLIKRAFRCMRASPVSAHIPPSRCGSAPYLVLDHDAGGGAYSFRESLTSTWLKQGESVLVWQYLGGVDRYLFEWRTAGASGAWYRADCLEDCLAFLRSVAPQVIFLNSVVGWPHLETTLSGIVSLAAEARLHVFLHDFFVVCPAYPLLNKEERFCGVPRKPSVCHACLTGNSYRAENTDTDITYWRLIWKRFLLRADTVAVADESVRELILATYPELEGKITVRALEPLRRWTPLPATLPRETAVIGVIGNIARHKGAGIVESLMRLIDEQNLDLSVAVIGELESSLRHPRLRVTGPYEHARLPELVSRHQIAVCLVPSPLPETFCYVAQEAEMLGLPLVCLDLGAQGRRARRYAKGFVAPTPDAVGCLAAIREALAR